MFITVVTYHISKGVPLGLGALMVQTPLQKP